MTSARKMLLVTLEQHKPQGHIKRKGTGLCLILGSAKLTIKEGEPSGSTDRRGWELIPRCHPAPQHGH